jgi:hypothetical protein
MNKHINLTLLVENIFVWGGVAASYALAFLPIVQVFAGMAALVFSVLSIVKLIKNWSRNESNNL